MSQEPRTQEVLLHKIKCAWEGGQKKKRTKIKTFVLLCVSNDMSKKSMGLQKLEAKIHYNLVLYCHNGYHTSCFYCVFSTQTTLHSLIVYSFVPKESPLVSTRAIIISIIFTSSKDRTLRGFNCNSC